ncbi:MAG TPA: transcriptional regulator, partial [Micromonosporaceae bacterium]
EILSGRQVVSYDLLVRIADGLGVPRGHLGLAYDDATAALLAADRSATTGAEDAEDAKRMLARLAELTVGAATVDPRSWSQPFPLTWAPSPDRVGQADVDRLTSMTAQLRALDHEYGGGACRDAVLGQISWAQQLLRARVTEDASRSLHLAVAELHVLAGWTSFDVGLVSPARRHFARALEHARFVDESALVAKVLYCLGRVHVHHGWGAQAVHLFQLGQVAAQQSGYARATAMVEANLGWAHAVVGNEKLALGAVSRARDEFGRAEQEAAPTWLAFFDSAELQALRATALANLTTPSQQQRAEAIDRLWLSTALRELPQVRPRTFELVTLSGLLLDTGDIDQAIRVGHQAVDLAINLRSKRVLDRFSVLRTHLQRHLGGSEARELTERINGLRAP